MPFLVSRNSLCSEYVKYVVNEQTSMIIAKQNVAIPLFFIFHLTSDDYSNPEFCHFVSFYPVNKPAANKPQCGASKTFVNTEIQLMAQ
jgi:hypothetical protein